MHDVWIRCDSLMLGQLKITQWKANDETDIKVYQEHEVNEILHNGYVNVEVEKNVKRIIAEINFEFNHNHYQQMQRIDVPSTSLTKFKCFFDLTPEKINITINNLIGRPLQVPVQVSFTGGECDTST